MSSACIVLQSDFGHGNSAAAMYGVVKSVQSQLKVFDLTHHVPQFNVKAAGQNLAAQLLHWPEGTIFVSVVDPSMGTSFRPCAALTEDGYYIFTADNGSLKYVEEQHGLKEVRDLSELKAAYAEGQGSEILHGRDLAYCAALLAAGEKTFEQLGPQYSSREG